MYKKCVGQYSPSTNDLLLKRPIIVAVELKSSYDLDGFYEMFSRSSNKNLALVNNVKIVTANP